MRYRVPCECGDVVSVAEEAAGTTDALYRVPLYRRLLEKYPKAKVSLPGP
jgi:hypothetical protein